MDSDSHSSKWDRVRVNYDLVLRIIEAKEEQNKLINFNQSKPSNHESKLHGSSRTI